MIELIKMIMDGDTAPAVQSIKNGTLANVNYVDWKPFPYQAAPIYAALWCRNLLVVKALLEKGIRIRITNQPVQSDDNWKVNPFNFFIFRYVKESLHEADEIEIIALLLAHGASLVDMDSFPTYAIACAPVYHVDYDPLLCDKKITPLYIAEQETTGTLANLLACEAVIRGNDNFLGQLLSKFQKQRPTDFLTEYLQLSNRTVLDSDLAVITSRIQKLVQKNLLTTEQAATIKSVLQHHINSLKKFESRINVHQPSNDHFIMHQFQAMEKKIESVQGQIEQINTRINSLNALAEVKNSSCTNENDNRFFSRI